MLSLLWAGDLVSKGKAPKPKAPPKAIGGGKAKKPRVAQTSVSSFATLTWDKQARRAPWVSRQSMGIHPGDPAAISKYRHSERYVARTKKVIRPRIAKVRKKFKAPEQ